tara:strand:+ start:2606 stop:2794 length:189 start_codon:yes stop_codon:yes gene_type:complete
MGTYERKRCPCGKNRTTDCDKCGEATCKDCAQVVVEKSTDANVLVYHSNKCTPVKYRKEVKE